jgi:hypothetical protein
MAKGTLIAAMKIGRAAEDEFHDRDHLRLVLRRYVRGH